MHHVKQVVKGRVTAPNARRTTKFSTNNTRDPITVLIAKNSKGEAAITADSPKATSVVCTIHPEINPAVVASPDLLPFATLCVST